MDEDAKNRQAAIQRARAKHEAYVAVFGTVNQPTAHGAIVLADLERFARFDKTATSRPLGIKDTFGPVDPYGTLYNLGLQELVKRIHQCIQWAEPEEPQEEES